ncbi:MAG TPA: hypothetical protein VF503_13640 [Sphingobium sp.]|uniref:hypothetical protein n=1 Tax=Sphingobium sp. TaxID=1912891 RepID=UPI002ED4037C
MDIYYYQGEALTIEEKLAYLARRQGQIDRIFERREAHINTIDWSAMTQSERDWSLENYPLHLGEESWAIDMQMENLIRSQWNW